MNRQKHILALYTDHCRFHHFMNHVIKIRYFNSILRKQIYLSYSSNYLSTNLLRNRYFHNFQIKLNFVLLRQKSLGSKIIINILSDFSKQTSWVRNTDVKI